MKRTSVWTGGADDARDSRTLLTDHLLTLAKQFKGQPKKAAEFFYQSLLKDPIRSQEDQPGNAPAGTT